MAMAKTPKVENGDGDPLARTKAIMAEMLRMPPRPHSEMKLGKPKAKPSPRKPKR
jgi:hypothetical protein